MNNLIEDISYVYLETTNFCNLDCAFCNRRDVVKKAKHMSLENWDNVLEKLSSQPQVQSLRKASGGFQACYTKELSIAS